MNNKIDFSNEARAKLLSGVKQLADAVSATLGPAGRNVIIQKKGKPPLSTKDGVTVAKNIKLEDPAENVGVDLVKEAATKTNELAGDGTTTATVLARYIYEEGIKQVDSNKTVNAVELKKGIEEACKEVIEYLEEKAVEITDENQLEQIAKISANNDEEIGKLVATALNKVGQDGIVTVEESKTGETYLEVVEGIQFNRGYKSPYFVTDNSSMQAILKEPVILITDEHLSQLKPLIPVLERVSADGTPILIIADDISGEALSGFIVNKMQGSLKICAVKAPEFGDRKKEVLRDIAILTGGTVITKETGLTFKNFSTEYFGRAAKVTVGKNKTTIIDAKGDIDVIGARVDNIKTQIDNEVSAFEKENLQNRLAAMVGGVSIIHVGGASEVEMKERRDRVDDALHATRAAVQEGIVPGGGIALYRAAHDLAHKFAEMSDHGSESKSKGIYILQNDLQTPIKRILFNAGLDEDKIENILTNLKDKDFWEGYTPLTGEYVNMFDSGIIDPMKVTRLALENAVSVAGTMLITEAVISINEDDSKDEFDPMANFM